MWNEYSYVYDLTNHQPVQQMTRTFAFDRRTGQLVDCCGASVNGDKSVRQTGLVGYVFPMGTQKQTYQVFDTTLKKTMPFVYSGTTDRGRHPGLRIRRERRADADRLGDAARLVRQVERRRRSRSASTTPST